MFETSAGPITSEHLMNHNESSGINSEKGPDFRATVSHCSCSSVVFSRYSHPLAARVGNETGLVPGREEIVSEIRRLKEQKLQAVEAGMAADAWNLWRTWGVLG